MKLKEKFEELGKIPEAEKFFGLSHIGSFINFMESAIHEVNDKEITEKYQSLQEMIISKRESMGDIEI